MEVSQNRLNGQQNFDGALKYLLNFSGKIEKARNSSYYGYQFKLQKLNRIKEKISQSIATLIFTNEKFYSCKYNEIIKTIKAKELELAPLIEQSMIGVVRRYLTEDCERTVTRLRKEISSLTETKSILKSPQDYAIAAGKIVDVWIDKLESDLASIDEWFTSNDNNKRILRIFLDCKDKNAALYRIKNIHLNQRYHFGYYIENRSFTLTRQESEFLTQKLLKIQKNEIDSSFSLTHNLQPHNTDHIEIPAEATQLVGLYNKYIIAKNKNDYISLFELVKPYTANDVETAFNKKFALKLHPDRNLDYPTEATELFKIFKNIKDKIIEDLD